MNPPQHIRSCGVSEHSVTSLAALGVGATMAEVDAALKETFPEVFPAPAEPGK